MPAALRALVVLAVARGDAPPPALLLNPEASASVRLRPRVPA
jgi:hypothetical protein